MTHINYDTYNEMTDKELEKIISHVKNIQNLRKKDVEKAFLNHDVKRVDRYLKENGNNIPKYVIDDVNFKLEAIDEKSIQFIKLLKGTTNWDKLSAYGKIDFFQNLLKNKEVFNRHKSDFKEDISNFLHVITDIDESILSTLYEDSIFEIKEGKVIHNGNDLLKIKSVLLFCVEKDLIKLEEEEAKKYYAKTFWTEDESERYLNKYPNVRNISFREYIVYNIEDFERLRKLDDTDIMVNLTREKEVLSEIKKFLKSDSLYMKLILNQCQMDKAAINRIIAVASRINSTFNSNFHILYDVIKTKYPELMVNLRKECKDVLNSDFKKFAEKYLEMIDLKEKLSTQPEAKTRMSKI